MTEQSEVEVLETQCLQLILHSESAVEMPKTDNERLELISLADDMIQKMDLDGRWFCGRMLTAVDLESGDIAEHIKEVFKKKMSIRSIQYYRQLFRAFPDYRDMAALRDADLHWHDVRLALVLEKPGLIGKFVEGVKANIITPDNIQEAIALLMSMGTLTPGDAESAGDGAGDDEGAEETVPEAIENSKKFLKGVASLQAKLSEMSVEFTPKIRDIMLDVNQEERDPLLVNMNEMVITLQTMEEGIKDFKLSLDSAIKELADNTPGLGTNGADKKKKKAKKK